MAIKCIIIDDEPLARSGLSEDLAKISGFQLIATAENALHALEILSSTVVDLIFLDIDMPGLNGLDFLKVINLKPIVILTTAYPQFALASYDYGVLDYLLKPISAQRLNQACNKVLNYWEWLHNSKHEESERDYFYVKSKGVEEKILFADVMYIEAANNYIFIYTSKQKHVVYLSLKSIEKQLPESQFTRVHKSYIISNNCVDRVEGNKIQIKNKIIPLSRNFEEKFRNLIIGSKKIKRKI
jgi:DNA-binding LytR/AlgR family response regulator